MYFVGGGWSNYGNEVLVVEVDVSQSVSKQIEIIIMMMMMVLNSSNDDDDDETATTAAVAAATAVPFSIRVINEK